MTICMLCGGVGGARAALALLENLPAEDLCFVVNTGDDFQHLGLEIWPDWDTVVYTLAGLGDPARGWGRADEGTRLMEELSRLQGPDWFHLGDRDVALHLYRTWALGLGRPPAQVAAHIADQFGVRARVLRLTDRSLDTQLVLANGKTMDFQSWFVRQQGKPAVARVESGDGGSVPAEVLAAIRQSDLLLLAPSNPFLSILPMLGVEAVARAVKARSGPTWAVSPLIDGKAVKGPLDSLLARLCQSQGQQAVIDLYRGWIQRFLLPVDELDGLSGPPLQACQTRLGTPEQRTGFARDLLAAWREAAV